MADVTTFQTIEKFLGINNVDPATRLSSLPIGHFYVYPLAQATNVDIDNSYELASRPGYTKVKTGTAIHSMWAEGDSWFYADGTALNKMDGIYGVKAIRPDLAEGARISFVRANDRVYYTNRYQIGYIKEDMDHGPALPGREFKEPLPAGQLIEYFLGCLYVARDNILYISDPLCDYYDVRSGYRIFKDEIRLLRHVNEDGMFVGDSEVWFVKGKGNEDFERQNVFPEAPVPFTDVTVPGKYIDDSIDGDVILWTSEKGICMGNGKGDVTNITQTRFTFDPLGRGTGFIREIGGIRHYINSLY